LPLTLKKCRRLPFHEDDKAQTHRATAWR